MDLHTGEMTTTAGEIGARLDRLPATRTVWKLVTLLSIGGFFEFYDLFLTTYVAPGLIRDKILTTTTTGFFGTTGVASFVAAFFLGLFIGTIALSFIADRFGRRAIFTFSLLWYSAATLVMGFAQDSTWLNSFRFIAGIGVGVELVTIDTYISELVPKHLRGRAFAFNQVVQFSVVPVVAFLGWWLVPIAPFGESGWRWVIWIGSAGAIVIWFLRRAVPESPRWLAARGRLADADRIMTTLERRVQAEYRAPLPPPLPPQPQVVRGSLIEAFEPPYLGRTIMLIIFNIFQTVGFYGFSAWVTQLLVANGIDVLKSQEYTFLIAIASPFGPLLGMFFADRVERKWAIVIAAGLVAAFGLIFGNIVVPTALVVFGILITLSNNVMSFSFHAYQTELYPTRIRAVAVGFVYSWSRLSVVFSAFVIAWFLGHFGTTGVFAFIAGSMVIVMLAIGGMGPRVRDLPLEQISH